MPFGPSVAVLDAILGQLEGNLGRLGGHIHAILGKRSLALALLRCFRVASWIGRDPLGILR